MFKDMSHEFFRPYFAKGSLLYGSSALHYWSQAAFCWLTSVRQGLESVSKIIPIACLWAIMWSSNWALPSWHEKTFQPLQEHRKCRRFDGLIG